MQITDVRLFEARGPWSGPTFPPGNRQAQPLDVYPEFNQHPPTDTPTSAPQRIRAIYVEILTDSDVSGLFGPIEASQVDIIKHMLRPFLLGRDPLATELLLDQMFRLHRHGRSGLFMTGVSAVDCALWDLKGKAWGQPVYRLLGGPTRASVPAYASMLGFSTEPAAAVELALSYQAQGFTGQKWFFRHGPGDGSAGIEHNLALAQALRAAVGQYYPLMFDAFMGWDLPYAIEMARALAPLRPAWMEEPVPPERVGALRQIRQAAGVPIATGEHVYTRWQIKELLVGEAVDVVQADPDWTGGISELVKICALCSAFDVPVIAHGHSLLPALHVAAAQSPQSVPMVEYLVRYQEHKQFFHAPIYRPVQGAISLPELPGLGIVLDEAKIDAREQL
ncbi:MAG: enolase C-terminal domain-like protein [Roseiflexaceae bacterium]